MTGAQPPTMSSPLLGRADLLERAEALLAGCRAGRGGLLWLHGEAGIGKTRLLAEIESRAHGVRVLRGTAWEDPGAPSFWVWSQILRGAASVRSPETWGSRGEPALALLDGRPDGPVDAASRFPLFDAVVGVLDLLAGEEPLLLVLEDVHWMDEGSLRLLHFLTAEVAARPVLVACSWRDHDADPDADLVTLAGEVAARGESWLVEGLGVADVRALIAATTGREVESEEADAVTARTGGNPLFVSEMARLAQARGARTIDGLVPGTAKTVILRRVAGLDRAAESALAAAAVLGTSLSASRLARVLGAPPTDLAHRIDDLVEAGVVLQTGDRVEFAHGLIRDAVYGSLNRARRRELHLAVAQLLEAGPGPAEPQSAELAHHLIQALPLVDVERTASACADAARAAAAIQAYEEAVRWSARALEHLEPDSPRRPDVLLLAGECHLNAGDHQGAQETYLEAAELGRRADDASYFARAALGFAAGLSGFEVRLWDRVQTDLLEEALARLGTDDAPLRAQVLARLSVALSFSASADRRRELAEQAAAIARRIGDPHSLAGALAAHCDAVAGPAYVELRESEAGEIIELARAVPDVGLELLGLRLRIIARWERGDTVAAGLDVTVFDRLVERLRQPFYAWYSTLWQGLRAHLDGDLEEMARCAAEVSRLGELGGSRNATVLGLVQSVWPLLERGRAAEAMTVLREAFGGFPELAADGGSLIRLYHGQSGEIRAAALPLFPQMLEALPVDKEWLPNLAGVSAGFVEGGVGGAPAQLLYETLLPWRELSVVDGIGAAMAGSVEQQLGDLATLLERYDAAADHFDKALAANAAMEAPLAVANVQRRYAFMLARRGAAGDAERREHLRGEALSFYRRVGITERVEELEALLGPVPPAGADLEPLAGTFRRSGSYWNLAWRGQQAVLPAVKGMSDLAKLLDQPDREVHVLDLVAPTGVPRGDLGNVIDDPAKAAYRKRLNALDDQLAEAEAVGDATASEAVEREREFLLAELKAAYGLGGRPRRAGDPSERARTTVTSRLRDAMARIDEALPELGRHLRASVRTGIYCSYSPETPTTWETRPTS